jgi:hypothetical protein
MRKVLNVIVMLTYVSGRKKAMMVTAARAYG